MIRLLNKGDLFEKFLEYRAVVAEALRRTYGLDKKAILQDIRAKNKPAMESQNLLKIRENADLGKSNIYSVKELMHWGKYRGIYGRPWKRRTQQET